jgi:flagellar biosynthesis GTPase FlhF
MYLQSLIPNKWMKIKEGDNYNKAYSEAIEFLNKAVYKNLRLPFIIIVSNNIHALFSGTYESYQMYILFGDIPQEISEYQFDHNGARENKNLVDLDSVQKYHYKSHLSNPVEYYRNQYETQQERLQEQEKLRQEQEKLRQEQEKLSQERERLQEQKKLRQEQEKLSQERERLRQEILEQQRLKRVNFNRFDPIQPLKFPSELEKIYNQDNRRQQVLKEEKFNDSDAPLKRENTQPYYEQNGGVKIVDYKIDKYQHKFNDAHDDSKKKIYLYKLNLYNDIN